MYNLALAIRVACAAVMFVIVMCGFNTELKTKEHSVLQMIVAFLYIYTVDMVFEVLCRSEEASLLVIQVAELTSLCILTMMFHFTVCYTGIRPGKILTSILSVWTVFANIGILVFFRKDGWYLKNVVFVEDGAFPHVEYTRGFFGHAFEVLIVVYALLILWEAVVYLGKESKSKKEVFRKRIFLVAILTPEVMYTTYYFHIHRCYELTIVGMVLTVTVLLYASRYCRLFDIVESTKEIMIENVDEGMVIYDEDRKLLYANKMAGKLLEEIDALIQQNPDDAVPPQKGEFVKDGKEYEVHGNPIYNEEVLQGYSYYILDITEKRAQMQEAWNARIEAEEANAAKTNFLASVSHELRTPLNGIIGMAEIALGSDAKADKRFQIKSILNSSKNLLVFINNLLDLSRIEANMLELSEESYSVEQNVFESMNVVNMSLGDKPIRLEAHISTDVPGRLFGDSMRVQHILLNLLSNAVKYTKEGQVTLEVYGEEKPEGYELHLDVKDTGRGIKADRMDEIFWSYNQGDWREHREANSTGLGLTITKSLVEHMGGNIRVESEQGKGSTFFVTIIQQIDVRDAIETPVLTSEMLNSGFGEKYLDRQYQYTFAGAKVLVVDDNYTNLIVAQGLLEPYQLQVKCTLSADEAIEEIRTSGEEYQLVFMDYMMPGKDGLEAVKEILAERDNLVIVAMTADVLGNAKQFFTNNGFTDYISKPVNRQKLENILLRYLGDYKKGTNFYSQTQYSAELEGLENCDIDVATGLEQNGRNVRNYCLVLFTYEKEMKAILPTLESMLEEDMQMLCTKVHGIRGSSRAIGAERVGILAGKLEEELKQELETHTYSIEHLKRGLSRLEREVNKIIVGIEQFMETDQAIMYLSSGTVKSSSPAEDENIAEYYIAPKSFLEDDTWWEKLRKSINGYDAIRVERLLRDARRFASEEETHFIENMQEKISLYDYAACKELIKQYKK